MTIITIQTRLDAGIYTSHGGGQTRVRYTWAAGPLNLLRAASRMAQHSADMIAGYGNVGAGRSWLQIGEQEIGAFDLPYTMAEARVLLARVDNGAYAAGLNYWEAVETAHQAGRAGKPAPDGADATMLAEWQRGRNDTARDEAADAAADRQARELAASIDARDARAADVAERDCADRLAAATLTAAAWRAGVDASQAARNVGRTMRRDWRRAGC